MISPKQAESARSIDHMVEQYVAARGRRGYPISTAEAVRALRLVLQRCPLSDRELADQVAAAAIRRGCNVRFDSVQRPDA